MAKMHARHHRFVNRLGWAASMMSCGLLFFAAPVYSQTMDVAEPDDPENVTVIETNIGLDQIVEEQRPETPSRREVRPQVDVRFAPNNQPAPQKGETGVFFADGHGSEQDSGTGQVGHMELEDTVFLRLNAALRTAIEENRELTDERHKLNEELTGFVGQKRIDANRINSLMVERDAYKQQAQRILTIKEKLENNISDYKRMYSEKEQNLQDKIAALRRQLAEQEIPSGEAETDLAQSGDAAGTDKDPESKKTRRRSIKILKLAETLSEQQKRLKDDEGEIHYNMGNVFFQKGMYKRALDEYRMAVKLMPDNPNAHFNLAYVSSEYTMDQKSALHHYRQYLRLNPQAIDANLVKEKILEAELDMQSRTGSPLEKDLLEYRRNMYTYQSLGP